MGGFLPKPKVYWYPMTENTQATFKNIHQLCIALKEKGLGSQISRADENLIEFQFEFQIARKGDVVGIYLTERGAVLETWLETADEAAACAAFFDEVCQRHYSLIETSDMPAIQDIEARLSAAAIPFIRHATPAGPKRESGFRVLIRGSDLLVATGIVASA